MIIASTILLGFLLLLSRVALGRWVPFTGPPFPVAGVRFYMQCLLSAVFCILVVGIIMTGQLAVTDYVRGAPSERIWWIDTLAAPIAETFLFQFLVARICLIRRLPEASKLELFTVLAVLFIALHVLVLGWDIGIAVGLTGGTVFSALYVTYLPSHSRAFLASCLTHVLYNSMILSLGSI